MVRRHVAREPGVDERIAVIGYGTGGGLAFTIASADPRVRLALAYDSVGTDIDLVENIKGAAVSFYAADNVAAAQSLPDLRAAIAAAVEEARGFLRLEGEAEQALLERLAAHQPHNTDR